jgi:prepilin-type N-terminal cleavage/methylation domain-containing protein
MTKIHIKNIFSYRSFRAELAPRIFEGRGIPFSVVPAKAGIHASDFLHKARVLRPSRRMTEINMDLRRSLSSVPAGGGGDNKRIEGFTLIELLVVIMIVAILSIVVVLTMNIPELLRQSRDSSRLSDIKTLNGAVTFYLNELPGGNLGSSTTIYVSLPDKTISGNTTSTCASLNLPTPPTGYNYQCTSPQSYRDVDGTGWMPVNLAQLSSGSPISVLPVDPTNQSSTNLYYTYAASGGSYVFTAIPESQKQKQALAKNLQVPNYPDVIAQGTDVTVNPLFNVSGLVGYWNLDEGTGATAFDLSGLGDNGTWGGSGGGASGYYSVGKIGTWSGYFDGSTDYIAGAGSSLPNPGASANVTLVEWINPKVLSGTVLSKGLSASCFNYGIVISNPSLKARDSNGDYSLGGTLTTNTWQQVAIVYSSTGAQGFINGVLVGTNGSAVTTNCASGNWAIGVRAYNATTSEFFSGQVDDIRIYNRALSVSEIQAMYNAEK